MEIKDRKDVQVGQVWQRSDGRRVTTTEEREFRGSRELLLEPIGKGRKSCKWDGGILNDLTFVGAAGPQSK
jgi:hypothetical protein